MAKPEPIHKSIENDNDEEKTRARLIFFTALTESLTNLPADFEIGIFALDTGDDVAVGVMGTNKDIANSLLIMLEQNIGIKACFDSVYLPMIQEQVLAGVARRLEEIEAGAKAKTIKTNCVVDLEGGNA